MAEKTFTNIRLGLKVDTLENWGNSSLVLKRGELAFATVAASAGTGLTEPVVMVKIGDGEHTFKDLDFNFYANAADVLSACKSEAGLKAFVNSVIADAGIASSSAMEALSGRVTTAEGKITTLENELNTAETGLKARMTAAETAITTLDGLVGDTAVADQITAAIAKLDLANTYEAKGEAAKVSTALETYKTANDAAVLANTNNITANTNAINAIKDGTTIDSFADVESALAGKDASGAAAQALEDAKTYADGLASNYDAKGSAATAESNAKAYADGLAGNYDASGSAAAAEAAAKGYTDSELTRLVGDKSVSAQIEALDLANTYAAKSHKHTKADITDFAHTHEIADVNGLEAALEGKEAAGAAADALAEAKSYADGKDEAIAAAKKAGDDAQADVDALETYVGTIPEGYTESSVIAYINKKAEETLASASGNSTETAASVKAALDTYKTENNTAVKANADAIAELDELVGDKKVSEQITDVTNPLAARVATIEGDYLKTADKTALQEQITTNANAIERLTNGVSAEEVDGVNDLIQYVKDHGTEVTGMKADIKANSDAIAAEKSRAEGAEADLQEAINGVAADVEELAGEVDTKAAQADLTALAGRVSTVEGDLNTETIGLKARMTAAEADIDALETKVGDKTVAAQIEAAIEALKIGDYAKAADLTAAINQHNTDKAALEASIATKANDADLAAIAKTGSTDDLVQGELVLVFDCGTSV